MTSKHSELIELLYAQDERFPARLREERNRDCLSELADQWLADERTWSQSQLYEYLKVALATTGHEIVFRKVLRHAERSSNHIIMSRLLVELDRCVRRDIVTRQVRDGELFRNRETLRASPNRCRPPGPPKVRTICHPVTGKQIRWMQKPRRPGRDDRLFTQTTRAWLRRRAWRYFRRLSFTDPDSYLNAIRRVLIEYTDDDFKNGHQVADNRALMHIAYFGSPALTFGPVHVHVNDCQSFADIPPSPWQPGVWASQPGYEALLHIVLDARSELVRSWAVDLLDEMHTDSLRSVPSQWIMRCLQHSDPAVRGFGLKALSAGDSVDACSDQDLVTLATNSEAAISRTGFESLSRRDEESPVGASIIRQLTANACTETSEMTTFWSLSRLAECKDAETSSEVFEFFESRFPTVRQAAINWLKSASRDSQIPFWMRQPEFWMQLARSSFAEIRCSSAKLLRSESSKTVAGSSAELLRIVAVDRAVTVRVRSWALGRLAELMAGSPGKPLAAEELQPLISDFLKTASAELRQAALAALAKCGETCGFPQSSSE